MNFGQRQINLIFCSATVLIVVLLSSCATNPYAKFYRPVANSYGEIVERQPSENPTIVRGESIAPGDPDHMIKILEKEIRIMRHKGYELIGYSLFLSSKPRFKMLRAHAEKIGARTAVFYKQYRHTERGHAPLSLPDSSKKIKVRRSGTISGDISATYDETETITLPKTYTTHWLPYSRDRYSYCATFWVRKPFGTQRNKRRKY